MRRLLFLILCAAPSLFGYASYSGWCEQGGIQVTVAGQRSTLYHQQSFPNFTQSGTGPEVTVYATGTTNKVTLYSDAAGTSLGNPFPCSATGQYQFYAAPNTVDVLFSGSGISSFTRPGIGVFEPLSFVSDLNGLTVAQNCAQAVARHATLELSQQWDFNGTCAANIQAYSGGGFNPSSGHVVALSGSFNGDLTQHFYTATAGAGSVLLNGPIAGGAIAVWFGADLTGSLDPIAPLNAVYASGASLIRLTNGVYNLQSAGWVMGKTGVSVVCDTGAQLKYTGSSTIDSVAFVGSASTFVYNQQFTGCAVVGNSHATYALHTEKTNHSTFSNLDLKDAATSSLCIDTDVADLFQSITTSSATGEFTYKPVNGIEENGSNTNVILEPVVELGNLSGSGSATRGIYLHGGATATTIIGGTSENNDINLSMDNTTTANQIITMDDEAPCTANVVDGGVGNIVSGGLFAGFQNSGCSVTPPSVHYLSTAAQGSTTGIIGDQIVIDTGAVSIRVESNTLGNNFSSLPTDILDSGTFTYSLANHHCCGVGLIPQKWSGAMALGTAGGGNTDVALLGQIRMQFTPNISAECSGSGTGCSGASADNALTASLTYPDGSLVSVAAGLRITIFSSHSLRAGSNTLNLNNTSDMFIVRQSDGGNLTVPFTGSGIPIDLVNYGGTTWIAMGLQ